MADARIEIRTLPSGLMHVTTWCGRRRLAPFPITEPEMERAFNYAVWFHTRYRCRPNGCPLHTLSVAHDPEEAICD